MRKTIYTHKDAVQFILDNNEKPLMIAGDETLLSELPEGNWIGGSIPYFMTEDGGIQSDKIVQILELEDSIRFKSIEKYDAESIKRIAADYPKNGVSFICIPGFSKTHISFGESALEIDGIFNSPLVGWVSGFDLNKEGAKASVFDGSTRQQSFDQALVMHCEIEEGFYPRLEIVNPFEALDGDRIDFKETSFEVEDAVVNGKDVVFSDYLKSQGYQEKLPIIANYNGSNVNVCFQAVDFESKKVSFYAPVVKGVEYQFSKPLGDYESAFRREMKDSGNFPGFSCNCILNYLYSNLEGKSTGNFYGPITFGEIAYVLLNQTAVYLEVKKSE